MFNLSGNTKGFKNILLSLVVLTHCVGCSGQVHQKENTQSKSTIQTPIIDKADKGNSIMLNAYKDNEKDGLWRTYHENGKLKSEESYIEGLKEGMHREWGDNGILLVAGVYAGGKANGLMTWYHEGGHVAGQGNMIDDVRQGPWKICDKQENGFCIDASFKDGKRDGIWKIYHEHAKDKVSREQTFKDDVMVSEQCYDEMGTQIDCK